MVWVALMAVGAYYLLTNHNDPANKYWGVFWAVIAFCLLIKKIGQHAQNKDWDDWFW